jgi:hypothetical protein
MKWQRQRIRPSALCGAFRIVFSFRVLKLSRRVEKKTRQLASGFRRLSFGRHEVWCLDFDRSTCEGMESHESGSRFVSSCLMRNRSGRGYVP